MALRASSGLVPDNVDEDAGVRDLGMEALDGKGGGRINPEGVMVGGRLPPGGMPFSAELRFGSGSASSCIGESKLLLVIYLGVGGSPELEASAML